MPRGQSQKLFKCAICGMEMNSCGKGVHIKKHGLTTDEYKKNYEGTKAKERKCIICGKNISDLHPNAKMCTSEACKFQHKKNLEFKEIEKNNKKFKDIPDIPICKICGWKSTALHAHITQKHKMSLDEYKEQFNITDKKEIYHESYTKGLSEKWSGENNPGYNHQGRFSPWSKKSEHHSEEQRKDAIEKANANRSYNTRLDYWLKRTNNEEVAKQLLKERQATCSLEKFVQRYGEEEGYIRWKARNEKWINALNSKSPEEKEEINRKKISFQNKRFSNNSQELFWSLYEKIKKDFKNVYFATIKNGQKDDSLWNNEYVMSRGFGKVAFLDFYIADNNKAIEFDGIYWHANTQEKDNLRELTLLLENPNLKIFHVKEEDFANNREETIQKCLEFIYN